METDYQLLEDLRRVIRETGEPKRDTYKSLGEFDSGKLERRFGNWENAVRKALKEGAMERDASKRSFRQLKKEFDSLLEQVKDLQAKEHFVEEVTSEWRPPKVYPHQKRPGVREATALAFGSDWHTDEVVTLVDSGGKNEFNPEIADKSIKRYFQGIIDLIDHHRASGKIAINHLVLAFMGDLFSGHIHPELVETTVHAPMQSCMWLMPRITDGVAEIKRRLDVDITVMWGYGNHGRSTEKVRIATGARHNYEHLLGQILRTQWSATDWGKNFEWDINPTPFQWAQVYDFVCRFHHGDSIKYRDGVGGISIPLNKAYNMWDTERRADYTFTGHWHTYLDLRRGMSNGSMIGHGPYSRWIRAAYEPPAQIFTLIDSKRGKCMGTPIWVRGDA